MVIIVMAVTMIQIKMTVINVIDDGHDNNDSGDGETNNYNESDWW